MQYSSFLKPGDTIGICAPSAGVGRKIESFDKSLTVLKNSGYYLKESASVRRNDVRSASAEIRAEELKEMFLDPEVSFVMCAAGGDFLYEILPYVEWEKIASSKKWLMGASDPTSLLFPLTTIYDTATIYGMNAGSYDLFPAHPCLKKNLGIISGEDFFQESYPFISSSEPFSDEPEKFDKPNTWISSVGDFSISGRVIGGCMDVLKDLIGTEYDGMCSFSEKYKEDGIILYLDNFALSAETFYLTLLQMKYAGWMKEVRAVLIGRTLFPSSGTGMTYAEAISLALQNIPVLSEADIGHTKPCFTMINGAMADLCYQNKKGSIRFCLK